MQKDRIILASSSPRRKKLLTQIGLDFKVIASKYEENLNFISNPSNYVKDLAHNKALEVANLNSNSLVIGADTIIFFDNKVFGKPKTANQAFNTLHELSGRTHRVITGVSLLHLEKKIDINFFFFIFVTIQKLKKSEIKYYIKNYNVLDKAGSYGIQGYFAIHIKEIKGCYFNIMGLPLSLFYSYYKSIQKKLYKNKDKL